MASYLSDAGDQAIPAGCGVTGVILADYIKSLDWKVLLGY
jgi:hypothetical protein